MTLELYNTLTSQKEPFVPIQPGKAGLYVCGITPYDETHLGHARCYVVFDVLKRVLEKNGFHVTHIQNFTDVDDKIIDKANQKGIKPETHAEPYIESFHRYMNRLNVKSADVYPRVTTHIKEIISIIERLVLRGLAYESDGSVYFSVRKYPEYGRLSKRNIDDLESGARVEVDERKKDPLDFALWKKAKDNEPYWNSPWGNGRPGWHIECSAMSMKYLGEEFDIHGGGQDLIFPHHENEIAQSVGATGRRFAHMWVHNGFVTVNQEKMSKSLGNFFTLKDILERYDPMVVRYFLLGQHYRSPLNFSDQELKAAESAWSGRVCGAYNAAREGLSQAPVSPVASQANGARGNDVLMREFLAHMANDLNTAAALGVLNRLCSEIFQTKDLSALAGQKTSLENMCEVLGLALPKEESWDEEILEWVQERERARQEKQWALSDQLRERIKSRGVLVEDTPAGPRLKRL